MPEIAKKITIDRKLKKVFVDGVEFPWLIEQRGPEVENIATEDDVPIVLLPVLATDVEVIPAGKDEVTYGDRDGRTSEEVMEYLDKR
ncbi:hypothetical protein SEA_PCORAL7_10 [Gordonia phage PCoral7]|uniref:Uncharacterized protein n=1 Tax=Gordonia phage Toast TaxID=2599852 RepID=A0A5J6TB22_9CAUD|nr:hypothetical protein JZX81_gp10 [Gordonia phage Toast]QFG08071.1 hypothetical protein PBI_TOAST_10 [Gordonia phage Toast]UVF60518.1 hypothetical protein SEA_PCORAL7_10 [Gordonia phage PCoral7]